VQRVIRYQGAIVRDHHLLLIRHREHAGGHSYWVLPGGGIEPEEDELACVRRELREETHLEVQVDRLLLDEPAEPGAVYRRYKTYLCRVSGGEAHPGHEPEVEAAETYAIDAVAWFDLRDERGWDPSMTADPITYPVVQRIRAALGYRSPA
jgi:8-oxo-dGTP diphosphatase